MAERALVVRDSMIGAGENEMMITRLTGLFTGETNPMDLYRAFMGGGPTGDPEVFRERPGESMGGGMGPGAMGTLQDVAEAVMPGVGLAGLMNFFSGDISKPAPLAEPGTYTLTLTIGEHTLAQEITIERKGEFTGQNAPFETSIQH